MFRYHRMVAIISLFCPFPPIVDISHDAISAEIVVIGDYRSNVKRNSVGFRRIIPLVPIRGIRKCRRFVIADGISTTE